MAQALPEHAGNKKIEVWFQDEARIGQKGRLTRIWAVKGSRTPILKDQRFQCAYIFGAVCPVEGKGAAILSPHANTNATNEHLKEISFHVPEGGTPPSSWIGPAGTSLVTSSSCQTHRLLA